MLKSITKQCLEGISSFDAPKVITSNNTTNILYALKQIREMKPLSNHLPVVFILSLVFFSFAGYS